MQCDCTERVTEIFGIFLACKAGFKGHSMCTNGTVSRVRNVVQLLHVKNSGAAVSFFVQRAKNSCALYQYL